MSEDRIQAVFLSGSAGAGSVRSGPVMRPVPTDEPGVLGHLRPEGETAPSQTITRFAPAHERPASYPVGLPFLPDREAFVTEYAGGVQPPGARWPCVDLEGVLGSLVEQSQSTGWKLLNNAPRLPGPFLTHSVALRRAGTVRLLLGSRVEDRAVVQLLDGPAALLGRFLDRPAEPADADDEPAL